MPKFLSFLINGVRQYVKELKEAPAAQYTTKVAAPSLIPSTISLSPPAPGTLAPGEVAPWASGTSSLNSPEKRGIFDRVVNLAGSRWAFLLTLALLGVWAIMGIVNGPSDTWQVVLQDTSSVQCYISATLLMRQQQNSTRALLSRICTMISRSRSNEKMLRQLNPAQLLKLQQSTHPARQDLTSVKEGLFDKIANTMSKVLGSPFAVAFYCVGVLVWLFLGIPFQFSDTWQLYVNTAVAIELTFTTMFLQSVRRQHEQYLDECLHTIDMIDCDLELNLRRMTNSLESNPVVESEPLTLSLMEKIIDVYAFVVGGTVGVFISVVVAIIWVVVGPAMGFDDNWWLIIGTYTGLVGFIDGFVLRNVHHRETLMADRHFDLLLDADARPLLILEAPLPEDQNPAATSTKRPNISSRISAAIGHACATRWASVGSVLTVLALLIVASAMQWTETGQLLCNTPTMIAEGFLLLMLIEAHNSADGNRRAQWADVLARRLGMERRVAAWDDKDFVLEVDAFEEKKMEVEEVSTVEIDVLSENPDNPDNGVVAV